MANLDVVQLRELFRSTRKQKGLKQQDLEEEGISATTISNFERGKKNVSLGKVYRMFEKVGINKDDLPRLLEEEEKKEIDWLTRLRLDLKAIETEIDCGDHKKAFDTLKKIELPSDHSYLSTAEYLTGKYYYKQQNWQKSNSHLLQAIRIFNDYPEIHFTNIKAASFYELARIEYRLNNLEEALKCVENGLKALNQKGERQYFKYDLFISKVIYLERLERNNEAMKILDLMWQHLDEIDTEIKLNMYDMQAKLYNKLKIYEKAIGYAETGIEIARREKSYDRCFELWTTLGTSHNHLGEFSLAKKCFQTAAKFENKIQRKFLSATNYFQLGLLYLEEGNIEPAEQALNKEIKISKEENDILKLCESLLGFAKCKLKQNILTEAVQHLEKALKLAEQHSFMVQKRDIALELTRFYENKDSMEHYKYMTIFYQNSLQSDGGDKEMSNGQLQKLEVEGRFFEGDPPDR